MSLALTDDHRSLARAARSFLAGAGGIALARQALEEGADKLPPIWDAMASMGWTGLALPEADGGQGFGLPELAIVVAELGRVVAPGPFLFSMAAAAVIAEAGDTAARPLLRGLADGSAVATVGLGGGLRLAGQTIEGDAGFVPGAAISDTLLLSLGEDLVVVPRDAPGLTIVGHEGLDPTRPLASVSCAAVPLDRATVLVGARATSIRLVRILAAAEASGIAHAVTEMSTQYAKERVQFGRPIGTFQAVKHHCADMLVDAELSTAAAWDAARGAGSDDEARLVAAVAAAQALPAALRCAQCNIQVHGGIGYTWEHDAHLFLRRAAANVALLGADVDAPSDVTRLALGGVRRHFAVELPAEAEHFRAEARAVRERLATIPPSQHRAALVESGYYVPYFPKPFGRGAGPVEQLVIEEELGDLGQPDLGIGIWILPTLIQHATADQLNRWMPPSLLGTMRWCQLFSEPNAGSDAAAIQTRARRVDGGWLVAGQKVWTSNGAECDRGLCTVRTDPDAPKHAGVSMLVIDMHAKGVEVRPLKEMTGETLFSEVFLDDVLVPDDDVVGAVGDGWVVARATLGNERVTIGRGGMHTFGAEDLLTLLTRYAPDDEGIARDVGRATAEELTMRALNLRHIERAVGGEGPGPEGNITKLLSAEHAQRVTELGLRIAGPAVVGGAEPNLARDVLFTRCLSIAGGTSEISRNQIAERLLGLPRDPLLSSGSNNRSEKSRSEGTRA